MTSVLLWSCIMSESISKQCSTIPIFPQVSPSQKTSRQISKCILASASLNKKFFYCYLWNKEVNDCSNSQVSFNNCIVSTDLEGKGRRNTAAKLASPVADSEPHWRRSGYIWNIQHRFVWNVILFKKSALCSMLKDSDLSCIQEGQRCAYFKGSWITLMCRQDRKLRA